MTTQNPIDLFSHFKVRPQLLENGKLVQSLVRNNLISCSVQVIAGGGETNLHAHKGRDGIYFVLQGSARFYTTDDQPVAEVGTFEGLLIPSEAPYWFESSSDDNLVLLLISAKLSDERVDRVDYVPSRMDQYSEMDGAQVLAGTRVKEGSFFGT